MIDIFLLRYISIVRRRENDIEWREAGSVK